MARIFRGCNTSRKWHPFRFPVEFIERKIYLIRGCKVMLDSDLAELYQVPTKRLNEAVRRNLGRFPGDFMFQLSAEELENLRSQMAPSSSGHGGRRHASYAFTEHGVAMLSSVLTSERAVALNILIIRASACENTSLRTRTWQGNWRTSNIHNRSTVRISNRFMAISNGCSNRRRNRRSAASASRRKPDSQPGF